MSASVLAELSYDAGVRALDLQERAVEQLRARTGILLAASSLTASFLGAQTIQHESGLSVLSGLALVSLAASVLLCVYVLLPKQVFEFSLNAPQVYETLFELRDDEEEVRRRLAYWLEEFWQRNQDRIDELGRYFFTAAVALIMQLVFWTLALASNISYPWVTAPQLHRPRRRPHRLAWAIPRRGAGSGSSRSSLAPCCRRPVVRMTTYGYCERLIRAHSGGHPWPAGDTLSQAPRSATSTTR